MSLFYRDLYFPKYAHPPRGGGISAWGKNYEENNASCKKPGKKEEKE